MFMYMRIGHDFVIKLMKQPIACTRTDVCDEYVSDGLGFLLLFVIFVFQSL